MLAITFVPAIWDKWYSDLKEISPTTKKNKKIIVIREKKNRRAFLLIMLISVNLAIASIIAMAIKHKNEIDYADNKAAREEIERDRIIARGNALFSNLQIELAKLNL